jgi:exonuclease VII large subunit
VEELRAVKFERGEARYLPHDVNLRVSILINAEQSNYFYQRTKKMSNDLDNARDLIDQHVIALDQAIEHMIKREKQLTESSKLTSGKLRDSVQKLSDGLARVEKVANFDRLERYADMLERIERSLSSLAEMEKSGLLAKISSSLK